MKAYSTATKILNFGSCNIDYVYSLDHFVTAGETESTEKMEVFPGGKGLNQSIALARAGAKVYHAGFLGEDGGWLRELLLENQVDVSYLQSVEAKNGHAIIQVDAEGENAIFLYPGSNKMLTEEFIDSVLADFSRGDILLLQNEINKVDSIIEKAYERGMRVAFNASPIHEEIRKVDLSKLSYLLVNEVEIRAISGRKEYAEALNELCRTYPQLCIMLTIGKGGCIYRTPSGEYYQSAFDCKAVDTTAAGDTFTGYFLAGIAQGEEISQTLRLSCAAAGIAVSRKGAAPSIPQRQEVLQSLPAMKEISKKKIL